MASEPSKYQVLARKYRPRAFDDVVGQPGVVSTLRNAITQGRLHHAYLFSGTRGVGKTTLARLFARALNCVMGPTTEPCGACDPCREIAAGSSMDVIEIDGASNRKVEDVDPLREAARYAPARDRHKIFLIDEVHMLSETAFNALLKILEEPPPRTLFLFATTEPQEVPETILSRCLHLACRRVGRQEIQGALSRIAKAEKIQAEDEALESIATLAAGSVRDALSLLDQVIAFTGGKVTPEGVRAALGLIDRGMVRELLEAIGRQDAPGALLVVERLSEAGADLTHVAREALMLGRDALVWRTAGPEAARGLGLSEQEAEASAALAQLFTPDALLRVTQALLDLADRMRREEHPRFLLETSALRMIRMADLTPIEDLLKRLQGGAPQSGPAGRTPPAGPERSSRPSGPSRRAEPEANGSSHETAPAAAPSAPAPAPDVQAAPARAADAAAVAGEEWSVQARRVVELVGERRMSVATFLRQASSIRFEADALVVGIQRKQIFVKTALESAETLTLIREEASRVLGRSASVRVEVEAPPSDDLTQIAAEPSPGNDVSRRREKLLDEAMKEPAVRAVMDLFKGQIVDIREGR
ncbi:MAG: DNA polymerase III subunit gamma/tau [Candidatus Polarisedimenticolia bacterium]